MVCGITFPEGLSLEAKLAHCRSQAHLQLFVQSQFFEDLTIVPCDIKDQLQHLCLLCCCGLETAEIDEHLTSAAHAEQSALAGIPPAGPAHPQPPEWSLRCGGVFDNIGRQRSRRRAGGRHQAGKGQRAAVGQPHLPRRLAVDDDHRLCAGAQRDALLRQHLWCVPQQHQVAAVTPVPEATNLWERLPPELLPAIIEASPNQLRVTLRLLSLSHRGTAPGWMPTFVGHTRLAVLKLPALNQQDIARILIHLPGLVELTIDPRLSVDASLLAALDRFCPGLQVLRCAIRRQYGSVPAPLSALKQLALREVSFMGERLEALEGSSLATVTNLKCDRCSPAALQSIASHLTSLKLSDALLDENDLPGPWLCRLETLSLSLRSDRPVSAPLLRLLAANQATLCSLTLTINPDADELPPLMASLQALAHLTRLHLVDCSLSALPPDLVDRLERLNISFLCKHESAAAPVRLSSRRLLWLRMQIDGAPALGLALYCPALVELETAGCRLVSMHCPRLRVIMPPQCLDGASPMPNLEVFDRSPRRFSSAGTLWTDPALLLTGSPRLRVLSSVRLTRPDLLARLCACGSLARLEQLHLDVTRLPNPLVLRLPGQLEHLHLQLEQGEEADRKNGPLLPPVDLHLEAPGLVVFVLLASLPSSSVVVRVRLHNCPSLACIRLESAQASIALYADEEAGGTPAMPLRSLYVSARGVFEAASLLGLLTRHGASLSEVTCRGELRLARKLWPQLMRALSGLPWLTGLTLNVSGVSSPLSLSCPELRRLALEDLNGKVKVRLACPWLEELTGIQCPKQQLKFLMTRRDDCRAGTPASRHRILFSP
ncbi:hypothetical protein PAPYR_6681 [Paratrimastix pyriformis]|uniref:Uncharacterized protein n=1 Tax=Paratrimastix pyriformis TaxID=342808 RepID=A0ABQ8UEN5_9EUKA|nr:hypothetical protein PAPYR_6681 [Paratrimastix pyriformis]